VIDQIWNPFFTTKTVGKGSGLGLALVYDIVKNHGGEIAVASTVGKGTEFIVRFPACQ
jgi:signal transduction histidine kinase